MEKITGKHKELLDRLITKLSKTEPLLYNLTEFISMNEDDPKAWPFIKIRWPAGMITIEYYKKI